MPGPKVTGGLLDDPYPIKTRGDVSRARVLPMPRAKKTPADRPAPKAPVDESPAHEERESEQSKSGFDYVAKRNKMMRGISHRGGRRSSSRSA